MKSYTRAEVAEITGINIHLFKDLHQSGLLIGTKVGKGFRYDAEQVDEFQRTIRGLDVSSPSAIWRTASMVRKKVLNELDRKHQTHDGKSMPSSV